MSAAGSPAPGSSRRSATAATQWASATYLYPLPEDGAVDCLKMVVGQRVIVGEIRRRAEAAEIYARAKAQGQKAALVEEQRPNMFTNRVANIGPGRDRADRDRISGAGARCAAANIRCACRWSSGRATCRRTR